MTAFNLLATGGVFGGGQTSSLGQTASLTIRLVHPDGSGWSKGLVRARLNRDCRLYQDANQTIAKHVISSFEETVLELDSTGMGELLVFQQALLKPLDGTAKTSLAPAGSISASTAYNPYYIVTLPDASVVRLVPPSSGSANVPISGEFDDYVWAPTVYVPY
jgi:hypothetical protein